MTTSESDAADTHEWVSFEHQGDTWIFDVTFLASNWSCIWNDGCLGVRAEPDDESGHGCCAFGAHFADTADRQRVLAAAEQLTAEQWQLRDVVDTPADAIEADDEGAWTTVVHEDACIFLNRRDFDGGLGCALHRAAIEAGESIVDWKPEVCWQLPLRLEHHEDENGHSVSTLREWRRHDWGSGGAEFHWWCTEDDLAFVEHTPVYQRLTDEITALVGPELTERLTTYLDRRGITTFLPHPAIRRRGDR